LAQVLHLFSLEKERDVVPSEILQMSVTIVSSRDADPEIIDRVHTIARSCAQFGSEPWNEKTLLWIEAASEHRGICLSVFRSKQSAQWILIAEAESPAPCHVASVLRGLFGIPIPDGDSHALYADEFFEFGQSVRFNNRYTRSRYLNGDSNHIR
jgi:hypothetical protein